MKFSFNKEELTKYLTPAMSSVSDKNTIAAISGILFSAKENGECTISSYDLEKGFRAKLNAEVDGVGEYIIPAAKLFRIVKIMPEDTVDIEINDKKLVRISSGKSEFKLSAMAGEDFPNLPELNCEKGFDIKGETLRETIMQVQHAIAISDGQRPVMLGAFFTLSKSGMRVVACDGNRLAVRDKKCEITNLSVEENFKFIIPGKTLGELLRLVPDNDENVRITFGRRHVIFNIGDMIFFSRLIDGEYINYERVIPSQSKVLVTVNRLELLMGLERVSLVAEDKSAGQVRSYVKCEFVGDTLTISSKSSTYAVIDEMPISKEGDDIIIGFNCRYLTDVLRAIEDDEISISLVTPLSSAVIKNQTSPDEGYLYMVCPVKMVD